MSRTPEQVLTKTTLPLPEREYQESYFRRLVGDIQRIFTSLQTPEETHLALTGLWFRMNDKIQRLKNMLMSKRESAVDEPMEDAYLDVSNYGIMATIVKNGKWGK